MGKKRALREEQLKLSPDSPLHPNQTSFRTLERAFKRRQVCICPDSPTKRHLQSCGVDPTLLAKCIDLSDPRCVTIHTSAPLSTNIPDAFTTITPQIISIRLCPGLYIMKDVFKPAFQREVITACLQDYILPPNSTNLDAFYTVPDAGLYNAYTSTPSAVIPLKPQLDLETQHALNNTATPLLKELTGGEALLKVRWASLGKPYNWAQKTYDLESTVDPAPPPLISQLTHTIVKAVEDLTNYSSSRYQCEAGVVNYYGIRDALMAHQDRAEVNESAPLVSLSFGLSGIFLIESTSTSASTQNSDGAAVNDERDGRNGEMLSVLVESGDVLVMSEGCRRAFHAMPRILKHSCPEYLQSGFPGWSVEQDYISTHRININMRQVYNVE